MTQVLACGAAVVTLSMGHPPRLRPVRAPHGAAGVTNMSPVARKLLAYAIAVVVLLGVFVLYTRPEMMANLADQIWACVR
jgi:hypothetical protein